VVAGDESDKRTLFFGEIFPRVFANEASGFLVVGALFRGGGPTGVMEQGGCRQKFQIHFVQTMKGLELLEEPDGPVGYMFDMLGFALMALHQFPGFPNEA
jgi:hypothetical protein